MVVPTTKWFVVFVILAMPNLSFFSDLTQASIANQIMGCKWSNTMTKNAEGIPTESEITIKSGTPIEESQSIVSYRLFQPEKKLSMSPVGTPFLLFLPI